MAAARVACDSPRWRNRRPSRSGADSLASSTCSLHRLDVPTQRAGCARRDHDRLTVRFPKDDEANAVHEGPPSTPTPRRTAASSSSTRISRPARRRSSSASSRSGIRIAPPGARTVFTAMRPVCRARRALISHGGKRSSRARRTPGARADSSAPRCEILLAGAGGECWGEQTELDDLGCADAASFPTRELQAVPGGGQRVAVYPSRFEGSAGCRFVEERGVRYRRGESSHASMDDGSGRRRVRGRPDDPAAIRRAAIESDRRPGEA